MNKEEITRAVMRGNTGEYSHVIIVVDRFDYEDYPVYVSYNQDIREVIIDYQGDIHSMTGIMEIYNYNLDLEMQLNENRAYHIEPIVKLNKQEDKKDEDMKTDNKINNNISEELEVTIEYAKEMHNGQYRHDGSPYIRHPLSVLENVLKYKKSKSLETLLMSACLHDTLEDTSATYYDIVQKFGPKVASIVLELTTDEDMKKALGKEQYLSYKMKNMSSWALVIKLCDRLDNVSDLLNDDNESFKIKYINESINILEFLVQNRELSKTHITIIEQIIDTLLQLCKDDIEKMTRLTKIFNSNLDNNIEVKRNINIYAELLDMKIDYINGNLIKRLTM